jgi:hypothetical protein
MLHADVGHQVFVEGSKDVQASDVDSRERLDA